MSKYIDQESALKRVGGSVALYKKLLGKFVDGNYQDQLDNLLASNNLTEAAAMAHTIKGVSANLSLQEIYSIAQKLEHALKNNEPYESLVPELRAATEATIEEIKTL